MKNYSVDIEGAKLDVIEYGEGDIALIFLHYWGGTSRTFQPVMRRLSDSFRCIAFDQRGWGRSSRDGDFSLASYAADTALLIDKLGVKRHVLVGHSMGGKVAQLVASEHRTGLLGLALIAPAPPSPMPVPEARRQAIFESYQSREGVKSVLSILSKKSLDETLYEQVIEDTLGGAPEAKSSWTGEGMLADISPAARRISVPSVVIVGDEDVVETESRLREEMPKAIADVTFDVLPGLGHLAPLEGPDAVAGAIRRFVLGLAG